MLERVLKNQAVTAFRCLDLTSLNDDDTPAKIEKLCADTLIGDDHAASVCVYAPLVPSAFMALSEIFGDKATIPGIATVLFFPDGKAASLGDTRKIVADMINKGASEIDMVFDHAAFKAGDTETPLQAVANVRQAIIERNPDVKLKVIMETGAFDDMTLLANAAQGVARLHPHFLKTSTGKVPEGATLQKTRVLLEAIRDEHIRTGEYIGLKISGKVATVAQVAEHIGQARAVLGPAWAPTPALFRIGASGILSDIRRILEISAPSPATPSVY